MDEKKLIEKNLPESKKIVSAGIKKQVLAQGKLAKKQQHLGTRKQGFGLDAKELIITVVRHSRVEENNEFVSKK